VPTSTTLILLSSLQTGGAERVTVSFAKRLAERGEALLIATLNNRSDGFLADELQAAGVRRHDLGARRLADPAALLRLLRLLDLERVGLIHAHGQDACIMAGAARCVRRVPTILSRHVLEEPSANMRQHLRAQAALLAYRRADLSLAVSQAAADRLAQLAHLPRNRIEVVRNGVEVGRFGSYQAAQAEALRCSLGFGPDDVLVLLPAVLRRGKGHELMLSALEEIISVAPSVRLLFAGAGEREKELRQLAGHLTANVSFLGQRDDIPELMAASNLVVLPSEAEALPTVLMEAAASGRAVIATRVGGTAEVVDHGRTGLLVPPNDPPALARAVLELVLDDERRSTLETAAIATARERFDLERQVVETLALWRRVAERTKA
jgi:glycosyltransferase involved in cell wall biosynthesis